MIVLAASGLAGAIPFLLVLACPLMMVFMMRGMHRGHGHAGGCHGHEQDAKPREQMSLNELKHARDELNEQIAERAEQAVHH